jgi:uncharacterized membrane protein
MYQFSVWLHILLAAIWTGGLVYTAAVVVPFAVQHESAERQRILRGLARRFRPIAWVSVLLLFLTGITNLALRPVSITPGELLSGDAFDASEVGQDIATWLPWKLILVTIMIALMAFHDITSIRAASNFEGPKTAAPGNRAGSMAAAVATLVALAVLYVSVRLVRG